MNNVKIKHDEYAKNSVLLEAILYSFVYNVLSINPKML